MGASAAFHLAEAGCRGVVLLEADQLACGSTSKSAGGVRLQFSDEINIDLAKRSIAAFEDFPNRPGSDIELKQVGYLFLLTEPHDVARFEQNVELQNRLGVPSRMLTPEQAKQLSPLIEIDDVLAATFCQRDGHVNPEMVVLGYAAAARQLGARIEQRCPVTSIDVEGDRICAVHTGRGSISTCTVVCAAGAWSAEIAAMVGRSLPVVPVSRPIWYTEPMPARPQQIPMTIDFSTGFYFHAEGEGLLFGMADPDQPPGFDAPTRADWLEQTADVVARRAPALLDVGIAGGWNGFYETTPDHNALIGEFPAPSRFLYATGFSGHGFQLGPAVGEVLRDLVLGLTPPVDISAFDAHRFERGEARVEHNIV
jgi:sarcosine oxidase, subunit beta